jgi:hypothetical protein
LNVVRLEARVGDAPSARSMEPFHLFGDRAFESIA